MFELFPCHKEGFVVVYDSDDRTFEAIRISKFLDFIGATKEQKRQARSSDGFELKSRLIQSTGKFKNNFYTGWNFFSNSSFMWENNGILKVFDNVCTCNMGVSLRSCRISTLDWDDGCVMDEYGKYSLGLYIFNGSIFRTVLRKDLKLTKFGYKSISHDITDVTLSRFDGLTDWQKKDLCSVMPSDMKKKLALGKVEI